MRRLQEKYSQPLYVLEQMPLGAFYHEIATLLADRVIEEAAHLLKPSHDNKERLARAAEWRKIEASDEWLETLIAERVLLTREEETRRREAQQQKRKQEKSARR